MKLKSRKKLQFKVDVWMKHWEKGNCSGTMSFTEEWPIDINGCDALEALLKKKFG